MVLNKDRKSSLNFRGLLRFNGEVLPSPAESEMSVFVSVKTDTSFLRGGHNLQPPRFFLLPKVEA